MLVALLLVAIQLVMVKEIVRVGYEWNQDKQIPKFRVLNLYALCCV